MTNLTIKYLIQHIFRMYGKPLEMSLEEFNNLLAMASDELFKEMASGYQTGNGVEVDSRIEFALRPFRKTRNYTSSAQSSDLGFNSTRLTLSDEDYVILAAWTAPANTPLEDYTNIDVITPTELNSRLGNAITYPSDTYPVLITTMSSTETTKYAYIIPAVPLNQTIRIMSLKKPTTPTLTLTYTNGIEVGGGTSLEWDSIFHVDIVRKMLQYLGLSVGNQLILEAVENQNMKEK
jgi:hypothetical protein